MRCKVRGRDHADQWEEDEECRGVSGGGTEGGIVAVSKLEDAK
jgi:hypothetical protein